MQVGDLVGYSRSLHDPSDVLVGIIVSRSPMRSERMMSSLKDDTIWRVLWSAPEGPTERGALERDLKVISESR